VSTASRLFVQVTRRGRCHSTRPWSHCLGTEAKVPGESLPLRLFRPGLDPKYLPKFHYVKRRFPITLKCRHMHGVLNVDEIKN
jgi:hypothetical protein